MTRSIVEAGGSIDGGVRPVDHRETLPFQGQFMLGWGVTGGTGIVAAEKFLKGGGYVVAVTSQPNTSSFERLQGQLVEMLDVPAGVVQNNLELVHGRIEEPTDVERVIREQIADGKRFKRLLKFPAAGVSEFGLEFIKRLDAMLAIQKSRDPDKEEKLRVAKRDLNERFDLWLPQHRDHAVAVNFGGTVLVIQTMAKYNGEEFEVDDLNSSWGYTEGPHFYGGKCPEPEHEHAEEQELMGVMTKHMTTNWYDANAQQLADQGVYINEYVAPVIRDTAVGGIIIRKILPLYPPEAQQIIKETMVERDDVGRALEQVWRINPSDRAKGQHPLRTFVMRKQGELIITHQMPPELFFDVSKLPF